MQPLLTDILYLFGFCLFVVLQSLAINGIHYSFSGGCVQEISKGKICKGNIFYMISPSFFEKHRGKWWTSNLWGCVRCMASTYSAFTFWPTVVYLFGFHWCEVFVFVFDVFILISLNYYIYKKL